MNGAARRMTTAALLILAAVALIALTWACRGKPEPPPPVTATATATVTSTPVLITPTRQTPTSAPTLAQETRKATETGVPTSVATKTPPAPILTPTAAATATPVLLGWHDVRRGDTLWGIGLAWYPGRFFAWGEEVWGPVCDANRDVVSDCRLIYPGQRLRVPLR